MLHKLQKSLAWVALLTIIFLQSTSIVFAVYTEVSVGNTITTDEVLFLDNASHSNGDIYVLGASGSPEQLRVYKWTAASSAWSDLGTVATATSVDYDFSGAPSAKIALNSSGNPGVVYFESDGLENNTTVYLKTYSGSWSSAETVTSSVNNLSALDIAYFSDDVAAIAFAEYGDNKYLRYFEGNSAPFTSTTASDAYVSNPESVGIEVVGASSDGTVYIVEGPSEALGGDVDVDYHISTNGGTSFISSYNILSDSTITDYSGGNIRTALDSSDNFRFVVADNNLGTDYIYFGIYSGGQWQTRTVASGVDMFTGASSGYALVTDGTTDYVMYHKVSVPGFYMSYSANTTDWTEVTIDNINPPAAFGDGTVGAGLSDNELVPFVSWWDDQEAYQGEFYWTITEAVGAGVPEFSTYVYMLTLILAGYLIYNKMGVQQTRNT